MTENQPPVTRPAVERRQLLVNFGWLSTDRAARIVVNAIVSVLVARHLGPDDFGALSFAVALTGILSVVASFGLEGLVVRDFVRVASRATWRAAWQLRLGLATGAYVAAVVAAAVWRSDSPRIVAIVAIMALGLFFAPADLIEAWFQAQGRVRRPTVARQGVLWLAAGWRLVLVAMKAPLVAFAIASAAEAALAAAALWFVFRRESAAGSDVSDPAPERRRLLREGWPLMVSSVLVTLTMQADRLVLAHFRGDGDVGMYAVAARVTELFHVLPVAFGVALMPRLTALRSEDGPGYWSLARRSLLLLVGAGLAAGLAVTLVGPWLVPAVFGRQFAAASPVLAVHAWTLVFVFVVSHRTRLLVIEGGTRWVLAMSLLTAALNLAGNLVLVPRHGGVGAAWAAVLAWAFSAVVAPWFFGPTRSQCRLLAGRGWLWRDGS